MSRNTLCPMKFGCGASPKPPPIDWGCEGKNCAWWSKGGERCGIVTTAMGLWAIVDTIKDNDQAKETKKKAHG